MFVTVAYIGQTEMFSHLLSITTTIIIIIIISYFEPYDCVHIICIRKKNLLSQKIKQRHKNVNTNKE